jgi:hypothetical protein
MSNEHRSDLRARVFGTQDGTRAGWEPPAFEVIPLDCEITAYAPDGNDPLF